MSQTEDTELRDLVVEALEKNGAIAKARARLRSDICAALEHEHVTIKNNPELEETLSTSEGVLSLLLVQEFLEYNNLHLTMFLYKAETGQGKGYVYDGRSHIADHFKSKRVNKSCPSSILSQILKYVREYDFKSDGGNIPLTINGESPNGSKKDDVLNTTCIVHDNSQNSSHSKSDLRERHALSFNLNISNSTELSSSDNSLDKEDDCNDSTSRLITDETIGSLPPSTISENIGNHKPSFPGLPHNGNSLPSSNRKNALTLNGMRSLINNQETRSDISSIAKSPENSSNHITTDIAGLQSKLSSNQNSEISPKGISSVQSVSEEISEDIDEEKKENHSHNTPKSSTASNRKSLSYAYKSQKNNIKSPRSDNILNSSSTFIASLIDFTNSKIGKDNLSSHLGNVSSPKYPSGKKPNSTDSVISELLPIHKNVTIRGSDNTHSDSLEIGDFLFESSENLSLSKSHGKHSLDVGNIITAHKVTSRKTDPNDNYDRSDSFEYDTEEWQDD